MRILLLGFATLTLGAQTPDYIAEGTKALDARQYDVAIEQFKKAITADPGDYGAHFNLGLAYSLTGNDALAIPEYQRTLELKPGIHQAELNLGLSFYNTGKFPEALEYYTKAVASKADSADSELGLGRTLARLGRRDEAEPHYRRAAALEKQNWQFLLELASLYEENKQYDKAIAIFKEFPENPGATERAGALMLRSGNTGEAISALESAVAKSPTTANRIALAEAYAKANQPSKAEPLIAQAIAAEPNDYQLRFFYGQLLRDQRKFPAAAEQFLASAKIKPDAAQSWTELAGILVLTEQFPQALAALDRVRQLGAEIAGHYFVRAIVLDRLQQKKEALESYQKFLAASNGQNPDQEFQARQRALALDKDLRKR